MTKFEISTDWSWATAGSAASRAAAAEIAITVGDNVLTRTFDTWSKTVTERMRVSALPLAEWLAASWWRLRYEPRGETGGQPPAHWRMAHDMPAAGGGYVWPAIRMASDGEAMQVSAHRSAQAEWEPGRYLAELPPTQIDLGVFEREIASFVQFVLDRLRDTGAASPALTALWADITAERADPDVRAWRELEARLGFDADQAPDRLIETLGDLGRRVGDAAVAEIAPIINSETPEQRLGTMLEVADAPGIPAVAGREIRLDLARPGNAHVRRATAFPLDAGKQTPWERGRELATMIRQSRGINPGPVSDDSLGAILGMRASALVEPTTSPFSLGVRAGDGDRINLHFRKRHRIGRRFEAARFIADNLIAPHDDHWLPQTDAGTARQKTQRAFAAELLMPIDDLLGFLDGSVSSDAVEDAGEHFQVSPLAVESHLANNGVIAMHQTEALRGAG